MHSPISLDADWRQDVVRVDCWSAGDGSETLTVTNASGDDIRVRLPKRAAQDLLLRLHDALVSKPWTRHLNTAEYQEAQARIGRSRTANANRGLGVV